MSWRDAVVWCNALTESKNAHDNSGLELVYYTDAAYTSPLRSCDAGTTATNDVAGSQDNPYVKNDANGYRLPTSNEWELAARYIGDFNGDDDIQDAGEYIRGILPAAPTRSMRRRPAEATMTGTAILNIPPMWPWESMKR